MHTYSHAMKLCVTCARWGGQRSAGQNVPAYFVDVIDDRAKGVATEVVTETCPCSRPQLVRDMKSGLPSSRDSECV